MEAVKQGSATVGLKSKTHAILVALKVLAIIGLAFVFAMVNLVDTYNIDTLLRTLIVAALSMSIHVHVLAILFS